ncbi:MAG: flagellar basal body rod C-terminal domain-containing protein [Thermodesulfobacteriota bacterium]
MLSAVNLSLSGIHAAFKQLNVSANNVANSNTDGFKGDRVTLSEGKNGGVATNIEKSNAPGPLYQPTTGMLAEASNVNLAEEMVSQITSRHILGANIAAYKTADEMHSALLDIFA